MSQELESRFTHSDLAKDGLQLVPTVIVQHTVRGFNPLPKGLQALASLWESDLPDILGLETEFNLWANKWHHDNKLPSTAIEALARCDKDIFPNIFHLLRALCTLPITTSECERSISRLRMVKTYLRSSMGHTRLNELTLLRIHRDIPLNMSNVVDEFALTHRTRMTLLPHNLLRA